MRILHTSDWHLGRTLYGKKERVDEHSAFLKWLLQTIREQAVDILLVAGDVFDTASPNNTSQKMYYDFLLNACHSGCKKVVVVGGNHDSPSFLNAPKAVLSALNVRVIGNATDNIEDEVIVIKDEKDNPLAVICAVPFLRERDISRFTEGESYADRSKRMAENMKKHYAVVAELAQNERQKSGKNIPVIATGHLSVAGGKTVKDDGVRETFIGNIECVGSELFPQTFDYVALGHYHIPAVINENLRYCGSPIPMGFGEADQQKCVYLVDFKDNNPVITTIEIPVFQRMEAIRGDKAYIEERLTNLKNANLPVWVEIIYEGNEVFPDLAAWVNDKIAGAEIELLNLQNRLFINEVLSRDDSAQSLDELNIVEVFNKLLDKSDISDEQKAELKQYYNEIVSQLEDP